jgi:hypothetical protein
VGRVVVPHKKNNRTTREGHYTYAKKIVTQTQKRQQHQHGRQIAPTQASSAMVLEIST